MASFKDGVSLGEWIRFVSSAPLGVTKAEDYNRYSAIYLDPRFDFSDTVDVWRAACTGGMLEMTLKGG